MVGTRSHVRNPYQVLSLSTRESSRDIRRRFEELRIRIDLGLEPDLSEDTIREARQALDDPVHRVRHQWFWLLADPPLIAPGIDFADLQAVRQATSELDAAAAKSGLNADLAHHDAAVVRLEALDSNPSAPINLSRLFSDWDVAIRSDVLWDLVATLGDDDQDPRVQAEIKRFRLVAFEVVLDRVVSALASVQLSETRLAEVVAALNSSGGSHTQINTTVGRLLEPRTAALDLTLRRFDESWNALDPDEERDPTPEERRTLQHLQRLVDSELLPQTQQLRALAPEFAAPLCDQVAERCAALSFAVLALLKDGWQALTLSQAASVIASARLRSEIERGRTAIIQRLYMIELLQALQYNDWPLALAYADLLQAIAGEDDKNQIEKLVTQIRVHHTPALVSVAAARDYIQKRVANPSLPPRPRASNASVRSAIGNTVTVPNPLPMKKRRRVWPWVIAIGAAILVLVNVVGGNNGAAPIRPRGTSTPSCRQELAQTNTQLHSLEPQVSNVQSTMTAIEARISPHATEISWIETNYPSLALPPDLYDRYQYVVNQYNAGVDEWKRVDAKENRLIDTYNRYVDQYNDLLQQC